MINKKYNVILVNSVGINGGFLVISALCKTMRELGYNAKILLTPGFPSRKECISYCHRIMFFQLIFWIKYLFCILFPNSKYANSPSQKMRKNSVMDGCKYKRTLFFNRKKTIVIYPEVQYGNPLQAKKIVRWLLYYYKYKNDFNAYGKNDKFIAFRQIFNDNELNPNGDMLKINYFNKQLYYQYNFGERSGNCYILRKGKNRNDIPQKFDGPVYDDNMTQEEFVAILNRCQFCYSYDTQTFFTSIAAVCGCIPVVLMEKGKTEHDYLSPDEKHWGVAYGNTLEQIEYAIRTRNKLLHSLDYKERNIEQTENFIKFLERNFGEGNNV